MWYHRGGFEFHPAVVVGFEGVNKYKIDVYERAYTASRKPIGWFRRPSMDGESTPERQVWHWESKSAVASMQSLSKSISFKAGDYVTFKTEKTNAHGMPQIETRTGRICHMSESVM